MRKMKTSPQMRGLQRKAHFLTWIAQMRPRLGASHPKAQNHMDPLAPKKSLRKMFLTEPWLHSAMMTLKKNMNPVNKAVVILSSLKGAAEGHPMVAISTFSGANFGAHFRLNFCEKFDVLLHFGRR